MESETDRALLDEIRALREDVNEMRFYLRTLFTLGILVVATKAGGGGGLLISGIVILMLWAFDTYVLKKPPPLYTEKPLS